MTTRHFRGQARRSPRLLLALGLCAAGAILGGLPAQAAETAPCPTYNPPNTLTLAGGTPQSAKLGTTFADPLQVALANTNGCPITTPMAGVAVTFAAPGSGPSGTFAASGANATLVGTNASGSASASQLTANTLPGGYQVVASSGYGSVSFSLVNTASGVPAAVVPVSPPSQSATVSSRYAEPLQVQVLDADGIPVTGVAVSFSLGSGSGGSGGGAGSSGAGGAGATFDGGQSQAGSLTNSSGIATSPNFTANGSAGRFTAAASVAGVTEPASFRLDNLAGRPPLLRTLGKPRLSAKVGTRYSRPLQVRLTDAAGRPLEGESVTFALGSGGGGSGSGAGSAGASFVGGSVQATETTNAAGIATSPRFEANATPGRFTASAAAAGVTNPATFSLDNLAGKPPTIRTLGTKRRSATVDSRYRGPLRVRLTDARRRPLQGESVTFTLGSGGGGAGASGSGGGSAGASFVGGSVQATETTNAAGIATSPRFEANATPGLFTATATVDGANAAASFQLDNLAGKPPTIRTLGTKRRSATVDSRYRGPLRVRLTDARRRPLQGESVTFTLGSGGGGAGASGSGGGSAGASFVGGSVQATETTNAAGIATSPRFEANATPGRFTATAAVAGVTNPATFSLDNLAGKPPTIRTLGTKRRSATVGIGYARPFQVEVRDAHGKPLQGQIVSFTLGSSAGGAGGAGSGSGGAGASFAGGSTQASETTDASGIATSPRFAANTTAGTFTATATVAGGTAAVSIRLDNLGGSPVAVDAGAAATESTPVGSRFPIPLAVTVVDEHGNPVAGALVTFTAPPAGASGTFARPGHGQSHVVRVHTDASGIAVAPPFSAGGQAGGYIVEARARGAAPAAFALVNRAPGA